MKAGIPRALLYFKNEIFWTSFFNQVGVEYTLSPETNKQILLKGENLSIDETCLPTKLLLGHIDSLIGKCDCIFVPRVAYHLGYDMCTKFRAQTDLVQNTFRGSDLKLLFYNVGDSKPATERKAILKLAKYLKVKRSLARRAYENAKREQRDYEAKREEEQQKIISQSGTIKILLVAHAYNVGDKYVGEPVITTLKSLGCEPVIAEYMNEEECIEASLNVSKTMPWAYNRHLVGAIELLKDKVDGVILLTTFPCGTDSMVNELIIRTYKSIPVITLTVDSQDGTAGMETRLESFVDIIKMKKERV